MVATESSQTRDRRVFTVVSLELPGATSMICLFRPIPRSSAAIGFSADLPLSIPRLVLRQLLTCLTGFYGTKSGTTSGWTIPGVFGI
ncbi:hypothetical protein BJY00DRAFT_210895 [Aspergillus carlsbadensis]|nr:hypothetical protein BJY00DRAFT_210895 [Aspergillus carlsbadensis]